MSRHSETIHMGDETHTPISGPATIGATFIGCALIFVLFIVWSLWGTDIAGLATQSKATNQFQSGKTYTPSPDHAGKHETGPAPLIPTVPGNTVIGTVRIPRFSSAFNVPVVQGATDDSSEQSPDRYNILNKGEIEHYRHTAMPGQVGNFAIAGHRSTYGRPFYSINTLTTGDQIIVETDKYWFVYTVTKSQIVAPTDGAVIAPNPQNPGQPPTLASITLTACNPVYSAAQRYVVSGTLSYWMNKADGVPTPLVKNGTTPKASTFVSTVTNVTQSPALLGWVTTLGMGLIMSVALSAATRRRVFAVNKMGAESGWYVDPKHKNHVRAWDGTSWLNQRALVTEFEAAGYMAIKLPITHHIFKPIIRWLLATIIVAVGIYVLYRWGFPNIAPHLPFQSDNGAVSP